MDKKFFIDTENLDNNHYSGINSIPITNDDLVNDFLTKNVSLESLIEKEIYNPKL